MADVQVNPPHDKAGDGRWLAAAPQWTLLHGTFEDLVDYAAAWPTTATTPEPVAQMLATTRRLFTHTWFVYDFGLTAVTWSLIAVEVALRHRLDQLDSDDRKGLANLLQQAETAGLLADPWTSRLNAARELRNGIVHGHINGVWFPGMLAGILSAVHEFVAYLFADDPTAPPAGVGQTCEPQ